MTTTSKYLSGLSKIVLVFSSLGLLLSAVLYIIYGQKSWAIDSPSGTIIWYSGFAGIYSILFACITLVVVSILHKKEHGKIWPLIKADVILLIITITLLLLLSLTIHCINNAERSA